MKQLSLETLCPSTGHGILSDDFISSLTEALNEQLGSCEEAVSRPTAKICHELLKNLKVEESRNAIMVFQSLHMMTKDIRNVVAATFTETPRTKLIALANVLGVKITQDSFKGSTYCFQVAKIFAPEFIDEKIKSFEDMDLIALLHLIEKCCLFHVRLQVACLHVSILIVYF